MFTYDVGVASVGFGPGLLQDGHPNLVFIGLAEDWVSFGIHRHVVINQDLLDDSIYPENDSVDAMLHAFLGPKDDLDSVLLLCQSSHCGQEVAISK